MLLLLLPFELFYFMRLTFHAHKSTAPDPARSHALIVMIPPSTRIPHSPRVGPLHPPLLHMQNQTD